MVHLQINVSDHYINKYVFYQHMHNMKASVPIKKALNLYINDSQLRGDDNLSKTEYSIARHYKELTIINI